jgi:hypothetical protein
MWSILTFFFYFIFCFGERVLDTQKRPRLVSCVLCPEWVYFCFLSNFYFDVYDNVSRDPVLVWLSDIARGSLCLGVCVSLVIFCAIKDSSRELMCGSRFVWRTCGNTGVFCFVSSFCFFIGILAHISYQYARLAA